MHSCFQLLSIATFYSTTSRCIPTLRILDYCISSFAIASSQAGGVLAWPLFRRHNLHKPYNLWKATLSNATSGFCTDFCLLGGSSFSFISRLSPPPPFLFFVGARGEPGNKATHSFGSCHTAKDVTCYLLQANMFLSSCEKHMGKKQTPSKIFAAQTCPKTLSLYSSLKLCVICDHHLITSQFGSVAKIKILFSKYHRYFWPPRKE